MSNLRRLLMIQAEPMAEVSGEVPLDVVSKKNTSAQDYVIGGQTEKDGEEIIGCGDITKNLFGNLIENANISSTGIIDYNYKGRTCTHYIPTKAGESFTLSNSRKPSSSGSEGQIFCFYDSEYNPIEESRTSSGSITYTKTAPDNAAYFVLCKIHPENFDWVQLERGNVATQYEPSGYKIPVNVKGRNLFDKNGVTIDANLSSGIVTSSITSKTFVIPCKPKTKYTLFCDNSSVETNPRCTIGTFSEYPNIGSVATTLRSKDVTEKTRIFSTSDKDTYIAIWNVYKLSSPGVQEMLDTCMLVEEYYNESNFPEYEPYHNETKNIYLNSPLLQGDYTSFKEQKVYRKWGVINLGELKWSKYGTSESTFVTNDDRFYKADLSTLCGRYSRVTTWSLEDKCYRNGSRSIRIRDDRFGSPTEFKESLDGVLLYYSLESEDIELCDMPTLELEKGNNTIDVNTTIKPSEVSIKAKGIKAAEI